MSSKAKKRKAAWVKREAKRKREKDRRDNILKALEHGDIEDTARAMGIRLR